MARILLVDDDIAEISAVKRILARAGHQAVLATNARDASGVVAQGAPDLLLVGATCEGGGALARLGEGELAPGVPVLVLGESPAAPADAPQVARPVDPAQLSDLVAAALAAPRTPAAGPAGPAEPGTGDPEFETTDAALAALTAPEPEAPPAPPPPSAAAPRRAGSAASSRRAAAEALRARAEELRRTVNAIADAPPEPAPAAPPSLDEDVDAGLEAILRRAEEAERAHAAERKARARQADRATVEAAQRAEAEQLAVEKAAWAREAEQRARAEEKARLSAERAAAEAERVAAEKTVRARAAEERARAEEKARAEAERVAAEKAARARAAEGKARVEAQRHARAEAAAAARADEERRATEEEARRAAGAEARARLEADARGRLEGELDRLRRQVGDDARRRESEEEQLKHAIESARSEMEALRRRGEDEARRRAEAEAEIERLARDAARRAAEAAAQPPPFELPVYRAPAEDPEPDPAQQAARRRVAALREQAPPPVPREEPEDSGAPRPARPPPPELRAGTLEDLPMPRLLAVAARAEATGRIDLDGEVSRSLWLEGGRVVGAASADPADRVEELALRLGLVTRDQHRQIAAAATSLSPRRAALLLLERGFLKPTELTALVRRRTEEVVFGAFADPGGRFRWAAAEVSAEERIALERSTLALAVEGVRRRWRGPQVDAVLGGPGTLLSPVSTGPSAGDLGLTQDERRAVALADGLRTLDEVLAASPLDPLSTGQVLAALVLVGSLAVRVFQGGRPAAAATVAIDLARVRDKLDQVRRADYFTILGVGRLCTPHEVREAADRMGAEFDPRRYRGVEEEGLDERLDEILRVVADAREILVDDRLRDEYLRGLGE